MEFNKDLNYIPRDSKFYKKYWTTRDYFAKFKKVVELPVVISKLLDNEYTIYTGYFTRDNVSVPFIPKIEVVDTERYLALKNQTLRKEKLKRFKKS